MKLIQAMKEIDWVKASMWSIVIIGLAAFWASAVCFALTFLTRSK